MRTLCAVFAHPDDESFSAAGTLARYADEGVKITLVTATSGEAGSAPVEKGDLGSLREQELRAAAGVLGIDHMRLLHLPDGSLSDRFEDLYAAIGETLREIHPQVVIVEDVRGITGHPDHMAVTRAVVQAVEALGEAGPLKLYEHVIPVSRAREGLYATPDDYITTRVNVERWKDRVIAALRAHASQVDGEMLERVTGPSRIWVDSFVCVRTRVPILIPEEDLFEGVPGGAAS